VFTAHDGLLEGIINCTMFGDRTWGFCNRIY